MAIRRDKARVALGELLRTARGGAADRKELAEAPRGAFVERDERVRARLDFLQALHALELGGQDAAPAAVHVARDCEFGERLHCVPRLRAAVQQEALRDRNCEWRLGADLDETQKRPGGAREYVRCERDTLVRRVRGLHREAEPTEAAVTPATARGVERHRDRVRQRINC